MPALPEAVLVRILGYLSAMDLVHVGQTCTSLRAVANSDGVWKRPCLRLHEKAATKHLKQAYAKVFVSQKPLLAQVNSNQVRVAGSLQIFHLMSHSCWGEGSLM